jgi:Right handed beta helix region
MQRRWAIASAAIATAGIVLVAVQAGASPSGTTHVKTSPPQATNVTVAVSLAGRGSASAAKLSVCGRAGKLDGPRKAPRGARVVRPSQDLAAIVTRSRAGKTFYLKAGTYTFGTSQYGQIIPKTGDRFVGAPGAVLDGQFKNLYAFVGLARRVWVQYLTIKDFGAAGDNESEGVVNHDSASGWRILHNTITNDAGAGVMIGSNDVVQGNCLSDNGQYGFNAYTPHGPHHITLSHNEIVGNDTFNYEAKQSGCGCTGGGKFWAVDGAKVIDNYVHGNHSVGLWADTNNRGFDIEGNLISNNYDDGLIYEISYNAKITKNTFIGNAIGAGKADPEDAAGAIYVSESGSDSRVKSAFNKTMLITHNRFINNWNGVLLWESPNRFCSSPDNSSTGYCTLVAPGVATLVKCATAAIDLAPLFGDCRWKTQHIRVAYNTFRLSRSAIGNCVAKNGCGLVGVFSQYGSLTPYTADKVPDAITYHQHNVWTHNAYFGTWRFMAWQEGSIFTFKQWRKAPRHEDAGSTFSG